jgi:manganese/zinc/iron transport system permease protein
VNYCLMAMTAATVVMAFTSVGSILVVALLIVPASCGLLSSERLTGMVTVSLVVAVASALGGHLLAKTIPAALSGIGGFSQVHDASTPGMMAVASGIFFLCFALFSPRHSVLVHWFGNLSLTIRMSVDDVLGLMYRLEERDPQRKPTLRELHQKESWIGPIVWKLAIWQLRRREWITGNDAVQLTEQGRLRAVEIVRGHRLWESYLHKNFQLEDSQLHGSAHRVEHYLNQDLQTQLSEELNSPQVDPHGKAIPPG